MDADELININVIIADRPYRIKIKPKEEENVRRAAKQINDKIKEFQNTYEAKDKQDYMAMCALLYAVDILNHESKPAAADDNLNTKLEELDDILTDFLSNK